VEEDERRRNRGSNKHQEVEHAAANKLAGLFCRMRPARSMTTSDPWFLRSEPAEQYGAAAVKPTKFEEHEPSGAAIMAIRTCISSPLANSAITLIHP